MMVKICGITNREDALVSAESGAAALGFNFYPDSPRYLAPEQAKGIVEVLPVTIWKVGVFVNETPENALRIAAEAGMDILQIHGNAAEYPHGGAAVEGAAGRPGILARLPRRPEAPKLFCSIRPRSSFMAAPGGPSIGRRREACRARSSSPAASTKRMCAGPSRKPSRGGWMPARDSKPRPGGRTI